MSSLVFVDRRTFLRASSLGLGGLVLGVRVEAEPTASPALASGTARRLGAFVQIGSDGRVTLWVSKPEIGQGMRTTLPLLVAEELDADWSSVTLEQADLDVAFGRQGIGGSSSVRRLWLPMRTAGAAARAMLVAAAAQRWGVDPAQCTTENGQVLHPAGPRLTYAELAEAAARLPVPTDPPLKRPEQFRLIGTHPVRPDDAEIVTGRIGFGLDFTLPGLLHAAISRPPAFGATIEALDDSAARRLPGVRGIFTLRASPPPEHLWGGVGVIADSTWAALRARDALAIRWRGGSTEDSATLAKKLLDATRSAGKVARRAGDIDRALLDGSRRIEAVYELPFLAHATLEPMNCTAQVRGEECEIWAPTQWPDGVPPAVAAATGIPAEKVRVHVLRSGGGGGPRGGGGWGGGGVGGPPPPAASQAAGAPVKLTWSRSDDLRNDYFRPMSCHRLEASLDDAGRLRGWRHRLASTSIEAYLTPGTAEPESTEIGGADELPYRLADFAAEYHPVASDVPLGWWRSVEAAPNAFAVESFVDEIAAATGKDPLALRLELLGEDRTLTAPDGSTPAFPFETGRLRRVLELAAERGAWGRPLEAGRGRGIAAWRSYFTYVAQVAEIRVDAAGLLRVERVVCAIDCGLPVHPDGVVAQVEGAVAFGLGAALHGEITVRAGRVVEESFASYPILTPAEMPRVEVIVVPSAAPPTGAGEPGLPPIAPALANAIFAATGRRLRRMPFARQLAR